MDSVNRIRLSLATWYALLTSALMLLLIAMLFVLLVRNRSRELDTSLRESAHDVVQTSIAMAAEEQNDQAAVNAAVDDLNSDQIPIYVFNTLMQYHGEDAPPAQVVRAVRQAFRNGSERISYVKDGQRWRAFIQRSRTPNHTYVVAALADETTLEQHYITVAEFFGVTALVGILLIGLSTYYLSGRAIRPIQSNVDAMRRFMADAAHELRTPVTTVRTHAEVELQRAPHDAETEASLRTILSESGRLTALVGDLLTLARADAGERVAQRERVFLDDIVSDATASVSLIARQKGIQLAQGKYEQTAVIGDAHLLRQLIGILLDNAIKFTDSGGRIVVDVFPQQGQAIARVSDTGIGIGAGDIPHIFNRFYRTEQARTIAAGAGLGLSIARWITFKHDGQIVVNSEVGKGSVFEVQLPLDS